MANLAHAAERQTISVMLDGLLKHLNNTDDKTRNLSQNGRYGSEVYWKR